MKKLVMLTSVLLLALAFTACSSQDDKVIKVGVSFYPFYSADSSKPDILDTIEQQVAEQGYSLEKIVFLNYAEANPALAHSEIDANLIQHELYMNIFNQRSNSNLEIVQPIYHATFALYSSVYNSLDDIEQGETVYIPNDGVNTARALMLLADAGLIELAEGVTFQATTADVSSNPKQLKFVEAPLTAAAGAYDEAGRRLAVMYPTFARSLNLQGDAERLYLETRDAISNAYAVSLAARSDNADDKKIAVLAEALASDAVKDYLANNYSWASTPAF
ncbi:MetQ/NlpA family ABC transporter substrate-binding protein [Reinekea thalattae]|uniref:ABC transporter substrate-binding protein n=1 Tax=Reinekea thalattae TaxID=2593301 RepID=A0A5C8ZBC6_9GAMM|nr:MetQ/NlpA family ABC transporter substrate-binding protein [Reinekea thalattae]TXR54589.1 ABC transporter substrate-binding protein [Reinekea thalattae]